MSLAHVEERDGVMVVTQSNEPALHSLRNTGVMLLWSVPSIAFYYLFFLQKNQAAEAPGLFLLFGFSFLVLVTVLQSVNRLFGRETFVFDRNESVFVRNGYTVGPLRDIRAVRAQVTGRGQYPIFRLILELPRCETVTLVRTHDIPAYGESRLSGTIFGDPDKRFASYTPWLNYDEQNLVHFLPPEIAELRRKITEFIGYEAK